MKIIETDSLVRNQYSRLASRFKAAGWISVFEDDPEDTLFIQKGDSAFGIIFEKGAWGLYSAAPGELITRFTTPDGLFRTVTTLVR